VLATKPFQLNITGDSTLQLTRFALVNPTTDVPHPGYFDIDGFPPGGQTTKGIAELDGAFSTANFELRSKAGVGLTPLSFNPAVTGGNEFYGDVTIPSQPFLAYVTGSRSDGTAYQRVSDMEFEPQTVTVTAPAAVFFQPGMSYNYSFRVTNTGPSNTFRGFIADDQNPSWVGTSGPLLFTLGTNQNTTVTVQLNAPGSAVVGTLNNLSLAVSTGGSTFTGSKNFASVRTMVLPEPNAHVGLLVSIWLLGVLSRRRRGC
jgi:hypothetical protein